MKKKLLSFIFAICIMASVCGCQNINTISKPNIEMKTTTQNSQSDLVTFTLDTPDNWEVFPLNGNSLICQKPSSSQYNLNSNFITPNYFTSPNFLIITNYSEPGIMPITEEYAQAYKDMLNGKYDSLEKIISENIMYMNETKLLENFPDKNFDSSDFDSPESIIKFFDILTETPSMPDYTYPETWNKNEWASDFKYTIYNGNKSKIIAVEYSYFNIDDINKKYKAITCYRDDNYSVSGAFDDTVEVSSGDIALWIANTLNIDVQYKLEDRVVRRKGTDY